MAVTKRELEKDLEAVKTFFNLTLSSMNYLQRKFLPVRVMGARELAKKIISFASKRMQSAVTLDELAFYTFQSPCLGTLFAS